MIKKHVIYTLTLLILLAITCKVSAQQIKNEENIFKAELERETWITDKILGLNPNIKRYKLNKFTQRKFAGNLTRFNKINFSSEYVAPCGNDYFTTVVGKYTFINKNKISISVDSVTYQGEWKRPTEHRKTEILFFLISKVEDTIFLTKENGL
ncbi:hypothetical protein [uncultured Algibacter sp.]|uniref:hypothetical protein n=1 Tax=uncultured Algibacter sp. TaxID=298659 RepID=UPI00321787B5